MMRRGRSLPYVVLGPALVILIVVALVPTTVPIIASEMSQLGMNIPRGILNAAVVLLSLPPLILLGFFAGGLNVAFSKKTDQG